MKRGAWKPGGMPVDLEHVFVHVIEPEYAHEEVRRIVRAGREPLVTVEPWEFPTGNDLVSWGRALRHDHPVYVRYMHEANGTWYPWGGQPDRFRREWTRWTAAMPPNVRNVFCPNVDYADAPHRIAYYRPDDPATVHVVGIDGYARNGESLADVFGPTLFALIGVDDGKPLWVCETGTPRGRGQAKWWRDGIAWAERQGIAAVIAFNESKEGPDERPWALSKAAQRAFLGG